MRSDLNFATNLARPDDVIRGTLTLDGEGMSQSTRTHADHVIVEESDANVTEVKYKENWLVARGGTSALRRLVSGPGWCR